MKQAAAGWLERFVRNPVIALVCVLHFTWGIGLLASPDAFYSTPLHGLSLLNPNRFSLGVTLLFTPLLALYGLTGRKPRHLLALMPQQFFLVASALVAGRAIYLAHYADGVPRPAWFILTDQLATILLAVFHGSSLIARGWRTV